MKNRGKKYVIVGFVGTGLLWLAVFWPCAMCGALVVYLCLGTLGILGVFVVVDSLQGRNVESHTAPDDFFNHIKLNRNKAHKLIEPFLEAGEQLRVYTIAEDSENILKSLGAGIATTGEMDLAETIDPHTILYLTNRRLLIAPLTEFDYQLQKPWKTEGIRSIDIGDVERARYDSGLTMGKLTFWLEDGDEIIYTFLYRQTGFNAKEIARFLSEE